MPATKEMKIKVVRDSFTQKSCEGKLSIDGVFECFTIEDADRKLESGGTKVQNNTCIPRGTYNVVWNHSAHFNKDMPQIMNVPQFEGVRIHGGNSQDDSEGCIIVGGVNEKAGDNWISSSKPAVEKLYAKIKAASDAGKKITIEVV